MSISFFKSGKYDSKISTFEKLSVKTINDIVLKIQNGDEDLRSRFIEDFEPFILKSVSKVVGNYIVPENNEEFSVGLSAFNEAIDKFNEGKYFVFLSFAEQVIRRRIIDYIRVDSRRKNVFPFTSLKENGVDFEETYVSSNSDVDFEEVLNKEEVECFEQILGRYEVTIEELVECAPKHKDARQSSIKIAKLLSESEDLYKKLNETRNLPYKDLGKAVGVSKRTLQRNNKFIIAVTIVFRYKFELFKSYIVEVEHELASKN